ncbi:hypothetical protein [Nonomuraea cavernae]|uniref:hypothetical protein n=1 Tax=Nonomuraea cavernae TaxID=2045107 RepID=UPI0034098FFE
MSDDLPEAATDLSGPPEQVPARPGRPQPNGLADPDVLLRVPTVKVEKINLEVEDLRARVSLEADVLDLLRLHVGVDVTLGRVNLEISGVEAKALLKVRLDNVALIIRDVLKTIDNNPQMLNNLTSAVGAATRDVGAGAGRAVGEVGTSAGSALQGTVESVGDAARDVVGQVPETARSVTQTAGTAVHDASSTLTPPPASAPPQPGTAQAPATPPSTPDVQDDAGRDDVEPRPSGPEERETEAPSEEAEVRTGDGAKPQTDVESGAEEKGESGEREPAAEAPPAAEDHPEDQAEPDEGRAPDGVAGAAEEKAEDRPEGQAEREEGRAEGEAQVEGGEEGRAEGEAGAEGGEEGRAEGEAEGRDEDRVQDGGEGPEAGERQALGPALKGLGKAACKAGVRRLRDVTSRKRS